MKIRRAPGLGAVDQADLKAQEVGHGDRTETRRVACTKVGIDVGECQPRIEQRSNCDLCMDLGNREIGEMPTGVLEDTSDLCNMFSGSGHTGNLAGCVAANRNGV